MSSGYSLKLTNATTPRDLVNIPQNNILDFIHSNTQLHSTNPTNGNDYDLHVLCVVKNGDRYLHNFLKHYNKIGKIKYIFLDNGSTDKTIQILENTNNCTVFKTNLKYKIYFEEFKKYLITYYCSNKWSLTVDIDELFIYPFFEIISLDKFLDYLNFYKYTAVVTQMLDMFPKYNLVNVNIPKVEDYPQEHCYYNLTTIHKYEYQVQNNYVSNTRITSNMGGIREQVFEVDRLALTKHALLKYSNSLNIVNDHEIQNVRIADVECTLLHYKYVGDFYNYFLESSNSGNHYNNSSEYKQYVKRFDMDPDVNLHDENSLKLNNSIDLVLNGFNVISSEYINLFGLQIGDKRSIEDLLAIAPAKHWLELIITELRRTSNDYNMTFNAIVEKLKQSSDKDLTELILENELKIAQLNDQLNQNQKMITEKENLIKEIYSSKSWIIGQFFIKPIDSFINLFKK